MSSPHDFLRKAYLFLKGTTAFSTASLSLLLIGLEKLIEVEFFSCPCIVELNSLLIGSIFIGPAFFTFTLMFLLLRPLKHECSSCEGPKDDSQQNCLKAFSACLILPVIWVFILFLHGEYYACAMTDWEGVYVFNKELNRSWCKPTDPMLNEMRLRELTRENISHSQFAGYVWISVFSALGIFFVSLYDCCISGKLCCHKCKFEKQSEGKDAGAVTVNLQPLRDTTSNQTVSVLPPLEVQNVSQDIHIHAVISKKSNQMDPGEASPSTNDSNKKPKSITPENSEL